ncbi:MAG: M23 family metallopeptidase [Deltaproteobacteria bacterium]|nr:M23 family metallopeptidase [Deltaproteobacteria bacterium]
MRKKLKIVLLICSLLFTIMAIWFLSVLYEGEKPSIEFSQDANIIGQSSTFDIAFSDMKSGIRDVSVTITQNGKERVIHSADFTSKGHSKEIVTVLIDYKALKLSDGGATLRASATDHSLRKNQAVVSKEVLVDITPPRISLLNPSNYINPGGSCVTTFKLSEEVNRTGVSVNADFFAAYPVNQAGNFYYVSYFAVPLDADQIDMKISIIAEDKAGNASLRAVPFLIRNKKFRHDRMQIGDNFLNNKMPEFSYVLDKLQNASTVESFVYVNEKLRSDNINKVAQLCKKTADKQLWDGVFLRLNNAATMATFGDKRTYYYGDKIISKSRHMGIDLASTKNAAVEAANGGIIAFTGYLGIFGNTVIIDHGLGLFSFYAHLSNITVADDQHVRKGDSIGLTGMSGLAGGDHLHYGVIVGSKFVNPQEWWDSHWIKDNVDIKLGQF